MALGFSARHGAGWRNSGQYAVPAIGAVFTALIVIVPLATLILFSFREGTPWAPGPRI